jgi:large subunit ribosomal protein L15
MFSLSDLPKIVVSKKQRVGRGEGSNRGKNAGKGHKGQTKHNGKRPAYFTGNKSDSGMGGLARVPKTKGFTAHNTKDKATLYIERIVEAVEAQSTVTIQSLVEANLINSMIKSVKVIKGKQTEDLQINVKFDENEKILLSKGVEELLK